MYFISYSLRSYFACLPDPNQPVIAENLRRTLESRYERVDVCLNYIVIEPLSILFY